MSGSALISGLIIGLAIGLAGRFLVPGRRAAPAWLTVALGVAAALLGSVVIRLVGAGLVEFTLLRLAVQAGFAGVAVAFAVITADREPRHGGHASVIRAPAAPPPRGVPGEQPEREERS